MERITSPSDAGERFLSILRQGGKTAALTGAGVSTASGIPDFRSPGGLYSQLSQRTFELDFFYSSPEEYYRIAIEHIHTLADRQPNETHFMLARLEELGLLEGIITQNIDGLHQKAGSKNVVEFHGDVVSFYCTKCEKGHQRAEVDAMIRKDGVPRCRLCNALIRPGIVFFGDTIPVDAFDKSRCMVETCDHFVVLGSSLEVNPAAGLALDAHRLGKTLIIVNRGPTRLDPVASIRCEVDLREFSACVIERLKNYGPL